MFFRRRGAGASGKVRLYADGRVAVAFDERNANDQD